MEKDKWFHSSSGSGDLSLTIKALLVSIAPLGIALAHYMGHDITTEQLDSVITAVVGIVSGVMFLVGIARKVMNWFSPKE